MYYQFDQYCIRLIFKQLKNNYTDRMYVIIKKIENSILYGAIFRIKNILLWIMQTIILIISNKN